MWSQQQHQQNDDQAAIETHLITKHIPSTQDAAALMGSQDVRYGHRYTPMILVPSRFPCSFYLTIPEGFYAMIESHGRFVGIWEAGLHFARPWERVAYLVTKQYIVYDTPVKECPTMDNVMVEIDVSVVFHVKDSEEAVNAFVYHLGPERLQRMLKAYQEEAVRKMARQKLYSNIYDLMDTKEFEMRPEAKEKLQQLQQELASVPAAELPGAPPRLAPLPSADEMKQDADALEVAEQLENVKRDMNQQLGEYGIEVYSVTITNVRLPPKIAKVMEEATTWDSRNKLDKEAQKFNVRVIEDNEAREQAEQRLEEIKADAVAQNKQDVAKELQLVDIYIAETNAIKADIDEATRNRIIDVQAESELKVTKLDKAKDIELARIAGEATADVQRVQSEMQAFIDNSVAEAALVVSQNKAQELKVLADAEAYAARRLKSRREFEARMKQLDALMELANNKQLVLTGTNKDSMVAQLVGANRSAITLGLNAGN